MPRASSDTALDAAGEIPGRGLLVRVLLVLAPLQLGRAGLLSEYAAQILAFGCVFAIAALSLNLLTGYAGQVSLGHAAFLGIGAYASGWATSTNGLPFPVGLLAAAGFGAAAALIVGFPALRIRGLNLALLTLGFGLGMASMVFRLRSVTGAGAGLALPRPEIRGHALTDGREFLVLAVVLLLGAWWFDGNVRRSKVGRALLALKEDEDVAASFGVNVARYKLLAFALSGAVAGIAGSLFGHLVGIAQVESFNFQLSLTLVVIVVLGGLGSRPGVIAAGLFFGILPRLFEFLEGWDLVVGPALLALTIAGHPGGVAQQARELRSHFRKAGPKPTTDLVPLSFRITAPPSAAADAREIYDAPLVIEDLEVRFGGLTAVDGFSLEVTAHAITGVIGPNGAGKSTVFNAVSGFVRPTAGRILLGGTDITAAPPHVRAASGLGRTFQLVGLIKSLSVAENLLLARHLHTPYRAGEALVAWPRAVNVETKLRDDAALVVDALGFGRYLQTPVGELSHGQQRIVEIACAMAASPTVLLLDEPTAGLSPAAAEALAERLLDLRDRLGQTIVVIEHHIPFVSATCERTVVMAAGRELAAGRTAEVLARDDVVGAYLGEPA